MKPKIPKLTKKERHMWIKALKKLLDCYKSNSFNNEFCPLCDVGFCGDCVWTWFTKGYCNEYAYDKFNCSVVGLKITNDSRWVKLRLRQIPRWIKKLEEGL